MTSCIKSRLRARAGTNGNRVDASAGLDLQELWIQLPRMDDGDVEPEDLRRVLDKAVDERTSDDWHTLTQHLTAALSLATSREVDAVALVKQAVVEMSSLREQLGQIQASLRYWKGRARAEHVSDQSLGLNDAVRSAPSPKRRGRKPKYGPAEFQLAQLTRNRVDPTTGEPVSERNFVERSVERNFPHLVGDAKRRKIEQTMRLLKNVRDAQRARNHG
jgi:hypothetical protein